jgi:3-oxoacyl-(acyl-carrier-protein) synthase
VTETSVPLRVAVTGVGVVSAAGRGFERHKAALSQRTSFLEAEDGVVSLVGRAGKQPLRDILTRRRDKKLFSRAAELLLVASNDALEGWDGDLHDVGLFFSVRREPPDTGEADSAIVASYRNGDLSVESLATDGRELYPPLLSLKTLPNMALAHVAIQFGICGPTGVTAGGASAGLHAVREGIAAVAEGRAPMALVGGTNSGVDGVGLRDWARLGNSETPFGESSIVLRLEPVGTPGSKFELLRSDISAETVAEQSLPHWAIVGHCGCVDSIFPLVFRSV